jgi:GH24 family phage-related lysozyme (muramidase)
MTSKIDLLDEDKPIAEQRFACLSFVSPEKIIKQKDIFCFQEFTKQYHFNKTAELLTKYSNFLSFKYGLNQEDVSEDLKQFNEGEKEEMRNNVQEEYDQFLDKNETTLDEDYAKENGFQTSVRGIKVRGVFPTQQEAEMRCKMLREYDPNHDVYVGPVGVWVPFHPDAYKTGKVEYLEKELNELMHEKNANEEKAKQAFDARVKESKLKAIDENMKKAEEHGNKLTQTINDKGELVSIENMSSTEKHLGVDATMEDIQNELFEGDNIVTSMTDHGLSELTQVKENAKKSD